MIGDGACRKSSCNMHCIDWGIDGTLSHEGRRLYPIIQRRNTTRLRINRYRKRSRQWTLCGWWTSTVVRPAVLIAWLMFSSPLFKPFTSTAIWSSASSPCLEIRPDTILSAEISHVVPHQGGHPIPQPSIFCFAPCNISRIGNREWKSYPLYNFWMITKWFQNSWAWLDRHPQHTVAPSVGKGSTPSFVYFSLHLVGARRVRWNWGECIYGCESRKYFPPERSGGRALKRWVYSPSPWSGLSIENVFDARITSVYGKVHIVIIVRAAPTFQFPYSDHPQGGSVCKRISCYNIISNALVAREAIRASGKWRPVAPLLIQFFRSRHDISWSSLLLT